MPETWVAHHSEGQEETVDPRTDYKAFRELKDRLVFLRSLIGQFDAERNTAVEAATMYWHFVGLVWVALFALVFVSI